MGPIVFLDPAWTMASFENQEWAWVAEQAVVDLFRHVKASPDENGQHALERGRRPAERAVLHVVKSAYGEQGYNHAAKCLWMLRHASLVSPLRHPLADGVDALPQDEDAIGSEPVRVERMGLGGPAFVRGASSC